MRLMLMDTALPFWKRLYKACECLDLAQNGFDPNDLIGKQFGALLQLTEHEGRPTNNERALFPIGSREAEMTGKWEDVDKVGSGSAASVDASGTGGDANPFG